MRKGHTLQVFENIALMIIFGRKMVEISGHIRMIEKRTANYRIV
jgi:hypothetical protein